MAPETTSSPSMNGLKGYSDFFASGLRTVGKELTNRRPRQRTRPASYCSTISTTTTATSDSEYSAALIVYPWLPLNIKNPNQDQHYPANADRHPCSSLYACANILPKHRRMSTFDPFGSLPESKSFFVDFPDTPVSSKATVTTSPAALFLSVSTIASTPRTPTRPIAQSPTGSTFSSHDTTVTASSANSFVNFHVRNNPGHIAGSGLCKLPFLLLILANLPSNHIITRRLPNKATIAYQRMRSPFKVTSVRRGTLQRVSTGVSSTVTLWKLRSRGVL
ncbi:hypothetical protein BKA70DRAFT_1436223 [Coprinopsis sp. MPI-PUGE-AT-0042]|nr:hypothetical protein BKA70DRAFT_1436223 [Coprinopsis sp. MPI-PUGE-AT-0042]